MTYSQAFVRDILKSAGGTIPETAYDAAKRLVFDALACGYAGRNTPGISAVTKQICEWGGKPESRLLISPERLPMPQAAFVNSAVIHALDFDDIHTPGTLHLNCLIVPVMLAAAEVSRANGKQALDSLILGYEMAARIGESETLRRRGGGFLPTSLAGSFGAVMTAAVLLGLTEDQTVEAMGINYAQISGNRQALLDASLTKRLQPAFAARSALWAVALAQKGITGPTRIFEGVAGYFNIYMNGDLPPVEELLGERKSFAVERTSTKRYPSCGAAHASQDAAVKLYKEEKIPAESIARVEIFGVPTIVSEPFRLGENPQVNVQFSAAWAVAHTLLRGPARVGDYTDEAIRADHEVIKLTQSITAVPTPEDAPAVPEGVVYADRYQGVIVHTHDGGPYMRCQTANQTHVLHPGPWEELERKFIDCIEFSGYQRAQFETVMDSVRHLEKQATVSGLFVDS